MKLYSVLLCLLITSASFAQTFEGTVTWSIKTNFKDTKQQEQMEKAMKQMSDPANQEKMKQMQEQMNNPQMKAMMDANPQIKERMDAAIKAMQGGGSMLPTAFIVKTDGSNSLSKIEGGMAPMEILYRKGEAASYVLNRDAKTYSVYKIDQKTIDDATAGTSKPKVTKTSETTTVLGHTCTKYVVETETHGTTFTQNFWTTQDLKGFDLKAWAKQSVGKGSALYYEGLEGFPLQIDIITPQMTMEMQATNIQKADLPASTFEIPAGFTETKGVNQ